MWMGVEQSKAKQFAQLHKYIIKNWKKYITPKLWWYAYFAPLNYKTRHRTPWYSKTGANNPMRRFWRRFCHHERWQPLNIELFLLPHMLILVHVMNLCQYPPRPLYEYELHMLSVKQVTICSESALEDRMLASLMYIMPTISLVWLSIKPRWNPCEWVSWSEFRTSIGIGEQQHNSSSKKCSHLG